MEISDIQLEGDQIVITFCGEDAKDIITIRISKQDAWQIHAFCKSHLSYSAQLKKRA